MSLSGRQAKDLRIDATSRGHQRKGYGFNISLKRISSSTPNEKELLVGLSCNKLLAMTQDSEKPEETAREEEQKIEEEINPESEFTPIGERYHR